MNRLVLEGIPYFGEESLEIEEKIRKSTVVDTIVYSDMLEMLNNEVTENKLVIIKENNTEYFTYLRDIRFNYRDKKAFIPYFTYKVHEIDKGKLRSNYKGHILLNDNTICIRYEYKFNKLDINLVNTTLTVYDVDTDKKYNITFKRWFNRQEFDMDVLYDLYLNSCVTDEDYRLVKHTEGYHLITKTIPGIKNKERELRKIYNLNDYDNESIPMKILNYRDVRNYRLEEYTKIKGFAQLDESYWKRILAFESFLFCILQTGATPIGEIKEAWEKLKTTSRILKYGDGIKLIIKDYWVKEDAEHSKNKLKTWSRI